MNGGEGRVEGVPWVGCKWGGRVESVPWVGCEWGGGEDGGCSMGGV